MTPPSLRNIIFARFSGDNCGRSVRKLAVQSGAAEYTYTSELTGVLRIDDSHYDARHHLAGNFPGGVADLHFRFTLRDGLIATLVIEP